MSLLVWLPLNGNCENQGLSNLKFSLISSSNTTFPDGGKIGRKSYSNNSYSGGGLISDTVLSLGNQLTMCCWVKFNALMDGAALGGTMGGQHRYATCTGMGLTFKYISSSTGYLSCNTGDGSNRTYNTYCGNTLLTAGNWYHVCFTYDGYYIKFYINGQFDGSHIYQNQKNVIDKVIVGAWSLDNTNASDIHANYKLYGNINDFRIYNQTLSPKEIKEIAKGLVAHYKLDSELPNLLSNSYEDRIGSGYLVTSYTFDRTALGRYMRAGEKCSLTVCFTPHANFGYWYPHLNDGNWGGWMPNIYSDGTTNRQIVSAVSLDGWRYWNDANPDSSPSLTTVRMYARNKDDAVNNASATIHWIKLQLGNQPAEYWSPSTTEDPKRYEEETDCSGNGNHAKRSKDLYAAADSPRYTNSKGFSGSQYIACGQGPKVKDELTISCWGYMSNWGDYSSRRLMSCTEGGGWNLEPYGENAANGMCFAVGTGSSSNTYLNAVSDIKLANLSAGWHLFTGTYDGKTAKIYIDGVLRGQHAYYSSKTPIYYHASNGVFIGAEAGSSATTPGGQYFNGKISDVRIYGTALSESDVQELYKIPATITKNGVLMANEFLEGESVKVEKTGSVCANGFGYTSAPLSDMKLKTLGDNSQWARIFHHDVKRYHAYFTEAQAQNCSLNGRYSRMFLVDKFKQPNGRYEFMLTYPNNRQYCPTGFELLECIQTDGNQYINTGVTTEGRWEFDIQFTTLNERQLMGYNSNGANYWGMNNNNHYEMYAHSERFAGERDCISYSWVGGNVDLTVDDQNLHITSDNRGSSQFTLFRIDPGYAYYWCKCKLYRCKYWNGNTLQRDFIPVKRKADGVMGLYDLVGKQFYTNSGTGNFIGYSKQMYVPINYVESNGTQYVDINLPISSADIGGLKFEMDVQFLNTAEANKLYGQGNTYAGFYTASNIVYWALGGVAGAYSSKTADTNRHKWIVDGPARTISFDGYPQSISPSNSALDRFTLFGWSPSHLNSSRCYGFKVWLHGIPQRDLIPVISSTTGEAGLYDKVTQTFFSSSSGNKLIAGPGAPNDPESPYEFLDYIAGTGSQFINSGIVPNTTTQVSIDFAPTGSTTENAIFGSSWSAAGFFLMFYQNRIRWHSRNAYVDLNTVSNLQRYVCYCTSSYIKVNGVQTNNQGSGTDAANNITIFKANGLDNLYGSFRLYHCDIWNNNALQRSFQPARRKSDGAIGLLDLVTNTWYGNAGSGTFTAGPVAPGAEQIERYNRWSQTNSPNTMAAATGFLAKSMSWRNRCYGLVKFHQQGTTTYTTDQWNGTWYGPIGQRAIWDNRGIPACDESAQLETELWVRYDNLALTNNMSIRKGETISVPELTER